MSDDARQLEREAAGGLADLYRRHAAWLGTRLRRRYGDDAEDIAQEAWRRMLSAYGSAAGVRYPKALLLRIATNLGRDRAAGRARLDAYVAQASPSVEAAWTGGQEAAVLLEQIILGLPEGERDVFVMSRIGGLTNSQIAERLKISRKTVEWRLTKALARCAAQLRR